MIRESLVSDSARSALKVAVALMVTWLVLVGPAWWLGGLLAVKGLSFAALLCLAPPLIMASFAWLFQSAKSPLTGLLVGMGLRMVVVLAGAVLVCLNHPELRGVAFVVWLAPCYFVALVVETRQVLLGSEGEQSAAGVATVSLSQAGV